MLGINGLITIAKYWRQWADPRPRDRCLQQSRSQHGHVGIARAPGGSPKVEETQDVPAFNYAQ